VCALESPVNTRRLNRLELGLRLIAEAGRENVALSFDPAQFYRAGHTVADLEGVDRRLLRYTQINDTDSATPRDPLCMPGDGKVPLRELLDALPQGLPLSLEYRHQDPRYTPAEWAQHALEGTRRFGWVTSVQVGEPVEPCPRR
jgi:sugar phosphate isomerase/epimerase